MTDRFFLRLWVIALLALLPFSVTAQSGYQLTPGDIVRVEVIEDPELNRTVLVAPDGRITFPLAGSVRAAGRTLAAIQTDLVTKLSPSFNTPPTVFVSLEQVTEPEEVETDTIDVFVLGEVANPGRLTLEPGATVLEAFAEMGGFSDFAAIKRVQLRRRNDGTGAEDVFPLNFDEITKGTSTSGTATLRDGDVILVPTRRLFE